MVMGKIMATPATTLLEDPAIELVGADSVTEADSRQPTILEVALKWVVYGVAALTLFAGIMLLAQKHFSRHK
jgi:hypothetical protein